MNLIKKETGKKAEYYLQKLEAPKFQPNSNPLKQERVPKPVNPRTSLTAPIPKANLDKANYFSANEDDFEKVKGVLTKIYDDYGKLDRINEPLISSIVDNNEIIYLNQILENFKILREELSAFEKKPSDPATRNELKNLVNNYWSYDNFFPLNYEKSNETSKQFTQDQARQDFTEIGINSPEELSNNLKQESNLIPILPHLSNKIVERAESALKNIHKNFVFNTRLQNPEKNLKDIEREHAIKFVSRAPLIISAIKNKIQGLTKHKRIPNKNGISKNLKHILESTQGTLRYLQNNPYIKSIAIHNFENISTGQRMCMGPFLEETLTASLEEGLETANTQKLHSNLVILLAFLSSYKDNLIDRYQIEPKEIKAAEITKEQFIEESNNTSQEQAKTQNAIWLSIHDTINYLNRGGINLKEESNLNGLKSQTIETAIANIEDIINKDIRESLVKNTELGQRLGNNLPEINFFFANSNQSNSNDFSFFQSKQQSAEDFYKFWYLVLQDSFPNPENEQILRDRDLKQNSIDYNKHNKIEDEITYYQDIGFDKKISWGRFNEAKTIVAAQILKQELAKEGIKLESFQGNDFGLLNGFLKFDGFFKLSKLETSTSDHALSNKQNNRKRNKRHKKSNPQQNTNETKKSNLNPVLVNKLRSRLEDNKNQAILIPYQVKSDSNEAVTFNKSRPFIMHTSPDGKNMISNTRVGEKTLTERLLGDITEYSENLDKNWQAQKDSQYLEDIPKWAKYELNLADEFINPNNIQDINNSFNSLKIHNEKKLADGLYELTHNQEKAIAKAMFSGKDKPINSEADKQ